jgi:hypothetical protein
VKFSIYKLKEGFHGVAFEGCGATTQHHMEKPNNGVFAKAHPFGSFAVNTAVILQGRFTL